MKVFTYMWMVPVMVVLAEKRLVLALEAEVEEDSRIEDQEMRFSFGGVEGGGAELTSVMVGRPGWGGGLLCECCQSVCLSDQFGGAVGRDFELVDVVLALPLD